MALTAVLAAGLFSRVWLKRFAFLANPCLLAVLLIASAWFNFEVSFSRSQRVRTMIPLLLSGGIVLSAAFWNRWWRGRVATLRRQLVMLVAVAAATASAILVSQANLTLPAIHARGMPAPGRCNVMLITMDTVRADHLPMCGYSRDTAPHLREFARQATTYDREIATADMTLPAHASIFTGLYPGWPSRCAGLSVRPAAFLETGNASRRVAAERLSHGAGSFELGVPVTVDGSGLRIYRIRFPSPLRIRRGHSTCAKPAGSCCTW